MCLKSLNEAIEDPEADGEVRLLEEEHLQAHSDMLKAQSRERNRRLVRRAAARQFGADATQHLDPILAPAKGPERLFSVAS